MQNPDMEFKIMFDDLTKEDNLLKPDEEGMSKQELIQEYKDRMGYIDEATGQMHHLTNFRPATKKRLQERGNKAKNILRQEISKLENEMKSPKKKKKKKKYDKEGKLTPEEISFILSPESSFNVDPESLQRGGKRKTRRRKRKTKRKRKRKTKRNRKRKRRRGGMNGSTGGTDSTPLPRPSTSPGSTGSRDLDDEAQRRIQEERIAERRRILQVHAQENARIMRIIERERQARRDALIKEGSSGRGLGGGKRRKRRKTKKRRR